MLSARKIKTEDELALLDHAAGIVDAVYEVIYRMLRPGVTENEVVAAAMKVPSSSAPSTSRRSTRSRGPVQPAPPHVRRPAAAAGRSSLLRHHPLVHGLPDVLLPHVQRQLRDAVPARRLKQCREWLDAAIELVRPGATTDQIAEVWPAADDFGEGRARGVWLQFGHGLGVGLYEAPMISRLHSFDAPVELEVGMVFALETYCPAGDGRSAARIEEEVVVTPTGPDVITRFPADELLVAGRTYVRGADFVNGRVAEEPIEVGAEVATSDVQRADARAEIDAPLALELYRRMLLVRGFEDRAEPLPAR